MPIDEMPTVGQFPALNCPDLPEPLKTLLTVVPFPKNSWVEVDASESGLFVGIYYTNDKQQKVLFTSWNAAYDNCGHWLEQIVGIMGWRILELEQQIEILKPPIHNIPLNP
jgi:hypothetical protein